MSSEHDVGLLRFGAKRNLPSRVRAPAVMRRGSVRIAASVAGLRSVLSWAPRHLNQRAPSSVAPSSG